MLFRSFTPKGEDARVDRDIITTNLNNFVFDVKEFNGPTFGAEWLIPLGNFFEAGAGA